MSKKRAMQPAKDSSLERVEDSARKQEELPDEKLRILQDNLVFVNGLPSDASSREVLMDDLHFRRYGEVSKLILNPQYPNKKGVTYQAYVTYDNHLQASLAIIQGMFELKALDGYKLGDRPLKVSFGTTKYCSHFLRGNNCPNPDCFYLHHYERQKEVSNGDSRSVFKQQNTKAIQTILGSLTTVANRVIGSEIEDYDEGFPSVMETLDYMVDSQELTTKDIEKAFQLAKSIKKDELLLPSEVSRVQSVAVDHREKDKEKDKEREKEHPKLVKSNSHSTMCTPTKLDDQAGLGASKKKQQRSQQKPQGKQKQLLLRQKQKQNKQLTSNTVGTRELKLEQKIEKLIIKEIWKKGHVESRSRFVQGVTSSREECLKLRGIVQKFLIAQN